MMPIDNPFFLLELRQHRRRRSKAAFRILAVPASGGLWLLGSLVAALALHAWARAPLRPADFSFGGLVLLLSAGCIIAGGYGGDLVFGREVRNKALTALQLLPLAPNHLLVGKLAFALLVVAVTWAAGLPLYLVAVLFEMATLSEALRALLFSGWAGLVASGLTVLGTSGQLPPPLDPIEKRLRNIEKVLRGFTVIGTAGLALLLAFAAWTAPDRWPFFGSRTRVWLPGCFLTLTLVGATASHARELLLGELSPCRRPLIVAAAGFTAVYLLVVGEQWHGIPVWGRYVVVLGPLLLVGVDLWELHRLKRAVPEGKLRTTAPARREDPWSERELDWLAARWSNPLYLRDLRALLRGQSLRRKLRNTLVAQALLGGVLYLLVKQFGGAVFSGASSWLFTPLFSGGGAAALFWGKERKSGALPLLLLTPLSSRELLAGRLAASLLATLPVGMLPLLLLLGGVVWLSLPASGRQARRLSRCFRFCSAPGSPSVATVRSRTRGYGASDRARYTGCYRPECCCFRRWGWR